MSGLKVAVIGGGIGGLVLGLALRQRGVSFDIYEQADELREIGAAVVLSANGTRELRRLGVGDRAEVFSVVPSALTIRRWDSGEVIADHPMGRGGAYEAAFGAPYYGVHRASLLEALVARLGPERVSLGRRCLELDERASGVELRFADGSTATADVVVGADGVHSKVRPHVTGPVRGQYAGTIGYRGIVPVERMPSLPDHMPLQFWAGPGRHLLHYAIDGGRKVNFLAVVRAAEWRNSAWMEECPVSDAADAFAGWHPAVQEMVSGTSDGARWALHDLPPLATWHTHRTVLMGDAAHAMVPHQGQGANTTIEDAVVLADCLADAATETAPVAALARYEELRRGRTGAVQRLARRTADLLHLPDGPELEARDAQLQNLYSDLAWLHGYDAHAQRAGATSVASVAGS